MVKESNQLSDEFQHKYMELHKIICEVLNNEDHSGLASDDYEISNFWLVSLKNSQYFFINEFDCEILNNLIRIWIDFSDDASKVI